MCSAHEFLSKYSLTRCLCSGMFANAEGISQRAPVNWSESVIGAAVCFPYVVALDEGFVTVHSMLDQQLKQTLSFRDGHILQDFEGIPMPQHSQSHSHFTLSQLQFHKCRCS